MAKKWTEEEVEDLKLGTEIGLTFKEIAEILDRPYSSTRHKASCLNICTTHISGKRKSMQTYVSQIPSDLVVLEEYTTNKDKILHKHSCGFKWKITPNDILAGKSCPRCAGNFHYDTIQYKRRIPKDLLVLEDYINNNIPILHQHSCGYEWKAAPFNILNGHSCPLCASTWKGIGYTYLIYFPELNIEKIGITNNIKRRLTEFGYSAEILLLIEHKTKRDALLLEKQWLKIIEPFKKNTNRLRSGNTETFQYIF